MSVMTIGNRGEQLNLIIRRGAELGPITATMQNPDETPVDLTGCTVRGQIRKNWDDAEVAAELDVSIIDAPNGQYRFGLTNEVTTDLASGALMENPESKYVWDLELEDSLGRVTPLYFGTVFVHREVTRGA